MDMETDGPLLEDVNLLKKTVEEEATQVRNGESVSCSSKYACLYEVGVVRALYKDTRLHIQCGCLV